MKELSVTTFPITRKTLAELNVIALNHNIEVDKLTYVELQQTLTIYALIELLRDYGIQAPFHLDIPETTPARRKQSANE
jgi:hypothetical protein